MANSFSWGGQTWNYGDLAAFQAYLRAHGVSYSAWAANHGDAASILEVSPQTYSKEQGYNETNAGLPTGIAYTPPAATAAGDAAANTPPPASEDSPAPGPPDLTAGKAPINWASVLGTYGLPADVIAELDRIWQTTSDLGQAVTIAQAYVRGTAWYAQTYPGVQAGLNAGLFTDEQGYRTYQNQVNQLYTQYYGRLALPAEVQTQISSGKSVQQVAASFQSDAIYGTLTDPLRGLFTEDELRTIANEQAGIDSPQGQILNQQANLAVKVNSLYQDFFGRGVSRAELGTLFQSGTSPQDVAKQFATAENIAAMNPAVSALFTTDEIHQIALDQAGGITSNGKQLTDLANLATQLNPLYHQYTNDGVSRDEVNAFYSSGKTVTQLGQEFVGKAYIDANKPDIQQASGAFGDTGQLSEAELKALGLEQAGMDTPEGQAAAALYSKAVQRFQGVFKGVLASPSLSFTRGRLASQGQKPPDVAA